MTLLARPLGLASWWLLLGTVLFAVFVSWMKRSLEPTIAVIGAMAIRRGIFAALETFGFGRLRS